VERLIAKESDMTFMKRSKTDHDPIDREAADWVVKWEDRDSSPGTKEQSRWFGWLQRSPRHVQAYFDMADLHERLGRIDPENRIDVDEWLAERRAPIVSIATTSSGREPSANRPLSRPRHVWWVAAASVAVLIAGASLWGPGHFGSEPYRTAVGQQSVNRLADGSVMNLNTRSRAQVKFSDRERIVELEGEALFTVARDPARHFYVRTRGATVRAVGTKFNVYSAAGETRVAVVEGAVRVSVESGNAVLPDLSAPLSAGESARISNGRVTKQRTPDIDAQVAWQHQQLVFEDAALAEVAAEFNRYNTTQIRIEDSLGQTRRLSGTFDALHPQSLLLYLRKDPRLSVTQQGKAYVIESRASE
jgi:transmembrane sensor